MSVNIVKKQSDGKLLIGGNFFGTYDSVSINRICRLDETGSLDTTFNPGAGANNTVRALATQDDGKILIGGDFLDYSGSAEYHLVRVNESGDIDATFNTGDGFNGAVYSIVVQDDGKILVGGNFDYYSGSSSVAGIIRLNSNGTIDTSSFNEFMGPVYKVLIQPDNKIVCVGDMNDYGGTTVNRIARLNSDGTIDNTFNIQNQFSDYITTAAIQDDGKIVVGGAFQAYVSASVQYTAKRILRLDSSGSWDRTFNSGLGFDDQVQDIKIQNKEILVAGGFTKYNEAYSLNFVKLTNSGSLFETFEDRFTPGGYAVPA